MNCIDHGKYKGLNKGGYARQWRGGKRYLMHRLAYCDANNVANESISDLVVRHTCDNPRCINPEHLLLGTQKDNMADKVIRGRQACNRLIGTRNGRCKISEDVIAEIKRLYIPGSRDNNQAALCRKYGISSQHMSQIVNNQRRVTP